MGELIRSRPAVLNPPGNPTNPSPPRRARAFNSILGRVRELAGMSTRFVNRQAPRWR
jgi:hypothetical protein